MLVLVTAVADLHHLDQQPVIEDLVDDPVHAHPSYSLGAIEFGRPPEPSASRLLTEPTEESAEIKDGCASAVHRTLVRRERGQWVARGSL